MSRPGEVELLRLFENAPLGMYQSTVEGRFLFVNRALVRMLGYDTEAEVLALDIETDVYVDAADRDRVIQRSGPVEIIAGVEAALKTRDGGEILVCLYSSAVRGEGDEVIGYEGSIVDITEQRASERRAEGAERMESLGVLAGGVAHDFNNLLHAVLGNIDIALRDLPTSFAVRGAIENARIAAARASDLTNQLLAYAGKGHYAVQELGFNGLIEEIADVLKVTVSPRAILNLDLAPDINAVQADSRQMMQVVQNLISNASDALRGKAGMITLRTSAIQSEVALDVIYPREPLPPGEYVCLEVTDDGCGMDARTRDHVFEPFFSTKSTGHGLGLAAVAGIVRSHGGGIRIVSESGEGTTFKVFIPALPAPEIEATGESPAVVVVPAGIEVLVVDDEALIRDVAQQMLRELGFSARVAAGGLEALDMLAAYGNRTQLVLLDMTMPEMDGEEVFDRIRVARPEVRIVLCSGYEEEVVSRFAGRGLAGFLRKPFTFDSLDDMVRRALGIW